MQTNFLCMIIGPHGNEVIIYAFISLQKPRVGILYPQIKIVQYKNPKRSYWIDLSGSA